MKLKIKGIFKQEEVKKYTRKDGTPGEIKNIFIEPEGSIYPIKVNTMNMDFKPGKIGSTVELEISVYPYYFQDGQKRKAFIDYYIPKEN
jgi:hypothetical protein